MWRHELKRGDSYVPKDALSGKVALFDLSSFMGKVMAIKIRFTLYLGSSTTPPCLGTIL